MELKTDREFLIWLFLRLVNVHGENEFCDYMQRLRKIINEMKTTKKGGE